MKAKTAGTKAKNALEASGREAQDAYNFKNSLAYRTQLLARLLQTDYMTRIVDTGIAPAQAYVLGELWIEEPLSQVKLARRLEIGKATIGKTLSRLEAAGVIERKRDEVDRRAIMIHLTEKGRQLREPLLAAGEEQNRTLVDILGADRLAAANEVIAALIDTVRPGRA